jgi:hypothetical protein
LGDDKDNLVLCCAIESRNVDLAGRAVTGDGGRLDIGEGGGGGAKVGAGRGGGGGTDRLWDALRRGIEKRDCVVLAVLVLTEEELDSRFEEFGWADAPLMGELFVDDRLDDARSLK